MIMLCNRGVVSSLSSKHKHWHYNANKIISFSSVTGNDDSLGTDTATVVKGPSLLTATGVDRPSPSLFFLPGLRSLPFWTAPYNKDGTLVNTAGSAIAFNDPKVTSIVHHVESYTNQIREEYLSNVFIPPDNDPTTATARQTSNASIGKHAKLMPDYDVNNKGGEHASEALHSGQWDWHSYILSGRRHSHFAGCCPITAKCLDEIGEDLFCSTPFSFAFFSTLQGTATIKAHTGPMNLRLRIHLPLITPTGNGRCGIRVGSQQRSWVEGKALVLDDSYEHEVWNLTSEPRVVLLFDIWHPDVQMEERKRIRGMFEYAQGKGWIGKHDNE